MGKTQAKKEEARESRLKKLPRSERLAKMASIKKKEGRVLDSAEKHALKMTTEYGEIMRLWEQLRTSTDPSADPAQVARMLKKKSDRKELRRQAHSKRKSFANDANDDDEDDDDVAEETPSASAAASTTEAAKTAPAAAEGARTVVRFEYKYPVINDLLKIITPQFASVVKTPRVSRVIQSMIKYGSFAHLDKLISLLSSDFTAFCNDAFAHFVVCALVRHAPHQQYRKILGMLVPIVPAIVSHKFGMQVVHAAYSSKLCSALDRNLLLLGVFKDSVSVMKHWKGYPVLEDIISQELDHQKRLLQRLFDLSDKLVSVKDAIALPFVQRLVYAFLRFGTKHEITELCVTIKPQLSTLCETREGSVLASLTFSLLEPRARKEALRSISERLSEFVVGKYSSPVIARLFDLVYDAQLLHKFVAAGVEVEMQNIINSPYGFSILIHLVTPDDSRRERVMLPGWKEHNLYSTGNKRWNTHEWLDVEYKKETVEFCNKPAMRTHLNVLPSIVQKFLQLIGDAAVVKTLNKTHVGLIAREVLNCVENEPAYQSALKLTPGDVALLTSVLPNKDQKRLREDNATPAADASELEGQKEPKRARSDASTPTRSMKSPAATLTTPQPVRPATPDATAAKNSSSKKKASVTAVSLSPAPKGQRAVSEVLDMGDDVPVERSARKATSQRREESAVAVTPARASVKKAASATPSSAKKKSL
jgi:pumilio homology domain family member 6